MHFFGMECALVVGMSEMGYQSLQVALLERGVMTRGELEVALQDAGRVPLERYLAEAGVVPLAELTLAVAAYFGYAPVVLGGGWVPAVELVGLVELGIWQQHKAVPLARLGSSLTVAFGDPFDVLALEEVERATRLRVVAVVAAESEVVEALNRVEKRQDSENPELALESVMRGSEGEFEIESEALESEESLDKSIERAEEAPVIRMVNMMLVEALRTGASDIHLEALERSSRLRYRIDGALIERPAPPKSLHNAVVSRIKIMADLDIAERRVPQDGRFKIRALKKEVDIRVSILPTIHGEKVVMRTLDKSNLAPSLAALGLADYAYRAMRYAIEQPHGIILVTGPTGSGKTTTLYSCLQDLNRGDVNVVTAEDPVEYQLAGINQVHVNELAGLTFASVLRSVLRQDPDIILVGEIRDGETADIAVKAALTGHLVLSTLHTNDAAGAVARLIDMEVPPFLLASSLILAQAQRLYRRLCTVCRRESQPSGEMLVANGIDAGYFDGVTVYEAVGCERCNGIGYRGRGAIMEVLPVSDSVRGAIVKNEASGVIRELAIADGMVTLKEAGLERVADGSTSLAAALETTGGG